MLDNYVVVDLEMTGMNPIKDEIIEIGAVKVEQGHITTMSVLVKPHQRIPDRVVELTGITNDMVTNGIPVEEAMEAYFSFAGELPLVGHHVISDYAFLKQWAVSNGKSYERNGMDTLLLARKFLPELEKKTLDALCEYYRIIREHHHRALEDAMATHILLQSIATEFIEEYPQYFTWYQLQYKFKKIRYATKGQIAYLKELMEYHHIEDDVDWEHLTQSHASRMADAIILEKGRIIGEE